MYAPSRSCSERFVLVVAATRDTAVAGFFCEKKPVLAEQPRIPENWRDHGTKTQPAPAVACGAMDTAPCTDYFVLPCPDDPQGSFLQRTNAQVAMMCCGPAVAGCCNLSLRLTFVAQFAEHIKNNGVTADCVHGDPFGRNIVQPTARANAPVAGMCLVLLQVVGPSILYLSFFMHIGFPLRAGV